jgi:4-aminobutyrate aminotransferase-like enzyme/Ser/Thr protein kinase RdoA (MazF antagonist)
MTSVVTSAPRFDPGQAVLLAREFFGLEAQAETLPSERDQNFHLAAADGRQYVLKVANGTESRASIELQNRMMAHLLKRDSASGGGRIICPEVCSGLTGDTIYTVEGENGNGHFVRLLTYLPGKPLADVKPHDAGLLRSLGHFFGRLDAYLADFNHPALCREFHWDLKHAGRVVGETVGAIPDSQRRALIRHFLSRFRERVAPRLADLRCAAIHNDGNDYNVLVTLTKDRCNRVSGVIDFGDAVRTVQVAEPAIICAYAMMNKPDPLTAAESIVAGYHQTSPLTEPELDLLFDLVCMRLCTSVCLAAHQHRLEPQNEYLRISEQPAWDLLQKLAAIHPRFAGYALRAACGLPPVAKARAVRDWLTRPGVAFESVMEKDLRTAEVRVLDLSVGSPLIDPSEKGDDPEPLQARLEAFLQQTGAVAGIGRYDEPRSIYAAEQFAVPCNELPERRTIHLGMDVYCPAGTKVRAPLEGTLHSFRDNAAHLDYGPTLVLGHRTDSGESFYTLYGHLGPDALAGWAVGQSIRAGQTIAVVGESPQNGGWPPHLHFQIILDMLGNKGDYPGAARPGRRAVWTALCPDPNLIMEIPPQRFPPPERSTREILSLRHRLFGRNLSISYREPLQIVRGFRQFLYREDGAAYLDGVNNVCHVGHCHPHVVAAGRRQMGVLNTNTRYLHAHLVDYAERLLDRFPEPLNVCFFVCSGSEANELALRMARTYTGRRAIATVDGAYHGNTQTLIDISPYKHAGPGGEGAPPWARTVVMPDGYRGPYKGSGPETGRRYALHVRDLLEPSAADGGVAAFICESMLGCGGQIVLPEGYLQAAFDHVRAAGGVCIADEVQVGFGRVGSHFWAFETQQVVPDIVTLGKPMGNGHPLAAVVTTAEIARSFANGMEYFNTYGGNPVSCAIGMAVLDVIENEGLQENARRAGERLLKGLKELQQACPLIGDVRGLGLYVGVELVKDRHSLGPATEEADYIINRMKDHGILISTDGPLENVLKLKPPMVFSVADADRVVETLAKILAEDGLQVP